MRALLLIAILGALGGLASLEVVARVESLRRCVNHTSGLAARNPFYGWGHRPNASGWLQQCLRDAPEWRTLVRINSRGLQDREIPYARSAARRILVLGDSFTAAIQVEREAGVVKQLEQSLNAPDPPGAHVEIVNAGVSGWSTDNALLFFEAEGWRYRPDLVILVFDTFNDVLENDRDLITAGGFYPDKPYFRLADGHLVRAHYPLPAPPATKRAVTDLYQLLEPHSAFVRRLGDVSFVWRYLQSPPAPAPGSPSAHPWQVYLRDYPDRWREAWRITYGLLLRLRQVVESRGARLVVVVMNGREEVSPALMRMALARRPDLGAGIDIDKPNRLVTRFLARRGVPTIPLLAGFRAEFATDPRRGFFEWDIHWTEAGHALAARLIERGLVEQGILPGILASPP